MSASTTKKNWTVRMICKVTKEVRVENCTEEQARDDPWDFATDEHEIDQLDWEVDSVKPTD